MLPLATVLGYAFGYLLDKAVGPRAQAGLRDGGAPLRTTRGWSVCYTAFFFREHDGHSPGSLRFGGRGRGRDLLRTRVCTKLNSGSPASLTATWPESRTPFW